MVKRLLNLKKFPKKRQGMFKKNENFFDKCTFGDRTLAYSGEGVQSRFYPGDLVTRTGDREIRSESGTLPDYPGELGNRKDICLQALLLIFKFSDHRN